MDQELEERRTASQHSLPHASGPSFFNYAGTGGIVLGGNTTVSQTFEYVMSGNIFVSGFADVPLADTFELDFDFGWNIVETADATQTFEWQTGESILYFYQVDSACEPTTCSRFIVNDGGQCPNTTFTTTILATSVTDVCDQLTARGITNRIASIRKFSRAAKPADQATLTAMGIDQTCNTLSPIPFCEIPDCLNFCIDYDVNETWGFSFDAVQTYTTTGGVTLGGSAITSTTGTSQTPMAAEPVLRALSSEIDAEVDFGFFDAITYSLVTLGEEVIDENTDPNVPLIALPTDVIRTSCDCRNIGEVIQMTHNYGSAGKLQDFLARNGLDLPDVLDMSYNTLYDAWQTNLHLSGVATDGNGTETWNAAFTWQCTTFVGGSDQGAPLWVYGASFSQSVGTQDYDTRVLLTFSQQGPCQESADIRFSFSTNTLTGVTTTDPNHVTYGSQIADSIGLFRSPSWVLNPNLNIVVAQVAVTTNVTRLPYDYNPIFPDT